MQTPMQNCYAVVVTDSYGEETLLDVRKTREAADAYADLVAKYSLLSRAERVVVHEMALSPVLNDTEDTVARLEHDVRTLQTMLTALNGRVAELSKTAQGK